MRYRPSGRAVVIALWRANIKPPLEVVVDNLVTMNYLPAAWSDPVAGVFSLHGDDMEYLAVRLPAFCGSQDADFMLY